MIGSILWLALPVIGAGVLHMVMVKRRWLSSLAVPMDGGRSWRSRRLLGDNKTWRGVVAMTMLSSTLGAVQGAVGGAWVQPWSVLGDVWRGSGYAFQYGAAHALFGAAYVIGELPNSFLKRRRDVAPGARGGLWHGLVDRCDSVLACLLAGWWVFDFRPSFCAVAMVLLAAVHLCVNLLLKQTGIRSTL